MADTAERAQSPASKFMMGAGLVWVAVLVYAASNSIVALLADIGRQSPVMGRNAITLCNLLFLGSLISLVPMVFMFWRDWTWANLKKLKVKDWLVLTVSAALSSAVTPALFFVALEFTSVTNVVLIGRIEPPLFLLASLLFLREKLDPWAMTTGIVSLFGAAVIMLLNTGGEPISFGRGEFAALFATIALIASTIVSRIGLQGVPLGIFSIYRTILGSFIYYWLSIYLFGELHFQDMFAGVVLKWVWVYAVIVVIIGQLAWNIGLKNARPADVALATSFSPVAALIIAMILLGEDPGPGLIPGGAIILGAIALGQFGQMRRRKLKPEAEGAPAELETDDALEAESRVNFKGA